MPVVMVPEKAQKLTDMQRAFVRNYLRNGGNGTQAAKEAGYGHSVAEYQARAHECLQKSHVLAEIHRQQESIIHGKLAMKALGTIERCMDDEKAPWPAKVRAAALVLESAGLAGKDSADRIEGESKDLESMSLPDLSEHLARLQSQLAGIANTKPVIDVGAQPEAQEEPEAQ